MIETRALELDGEALERSAAMLRTAMPRAGHMTAEFLRWQYAANPVGPALGLEAVEDGRVVSHCVVQPLVANLYGRQARGVMSLNAATLPDYLGRGLYFGLARELYAEARKAGYEFGVAVTNDLSTPGFVRDCGFELVRPLEARLGLGPIRLARRDTEVDFEKLWNEETIAWRLSPPHVCYRYEDRGTLARVLAPTGKAGIEAILGHVPARTVPTGRPVRRASPNPLRLWVGIDTRIDWGRTLYRNLPLKLRPSPLNLIFADLSASGIGVDPQRVRWSGMDFDDF
jgi:predicted N-acetyltransferase YhbS